MIVNSEYFPEKTVKNKLKNTVYDFEIIFINNNSSEISDDLLNLSIDDSRVLIKELDENNLMQTLNNAIEEANGKYIVFTNSLHILSDDTLKRAYNKSLDKSANILMFNQDNEETTIISRLVGEKTFKYDKIKDYLFKIDFSLHNFIYEKEYLIRNNLTFNPIKNNDIKVFAYKTIIKADNLIFFDKQLNHKSQNNVDLRDYLDNLEEIQNLIYLEHDEKLKKDVNNFRINESIKKYESTNIVSKKENFTTLRRNFIKIIQSENSEEFINTLTKTNRKLLEQVIISDSVEEYELLKKVSEDKNYVNYMKRYEKILQVEHKKISNFNKSLTSSNSWKLTKFLRIIEKV